MKNMDRVWDIVVNECYCMWSLFLENVANEGYTKARFEAEVKKCKSKEELRRLVNKFI